jgi:hypothetical protein
LWRPDVVRALSPPDVDKPEMPTNQWFLLARLLLLLLLLLLLYFLLLSSSFFAVMIVRSSLLSVSCLFLSVMEKDGRKDGWKEGSRNQPTLRSIVQLCKITQQRSAVQRSTAQYRRHRMHVRPVHRTLLACTQRAVTART